ncbi:MAG: twin-arginine translocation signal domain-containing protein [Gallionellaceae bacterium]
MEFSRQQESDLKKNIINTASISRRDVLRGTLAVACSMLLPLALSSSPAVAAEAAAKKMSKNSARYTEHATGEKKCSACANFIAASNTCKLVEGKVTPGGGCALWVKQV